MGNNDETSYTLTDHRSQKITIATKLFYYWSYILEFYTYYKGTNHWKYLSLDNIAILAPKSFQKSIDGFEKENE